MKNISVIGAGTMGNGIAHVFAMNGFNVALVDVSQDALDRAIAVIERNLDRLLKKERIDEAAKHSTLASIQTFTNLDEAVASSDLVIEAATENPS